MKTGYKTTEFWITLLVQITGIGVLTGFITPDQSAVVTDVANQGVELATEAVNVGMSIYDRAMALVAMLGSAWGYASSRGVAKKQ